MSLFKTREFWKTECDLDEKFDQNSLLICKLNTSTDFVIVGSHSGIIRIFNPANDIHNGSLSGYQATDLFLEKIFGYPILQLGSGRLVSGSKLVQLAILHPRSIGVYGLISKEGLTNHGTQNSLHLMYEHKLRRSAYNMEIGLFGGSQNRDFICVQSLDGMLAFFEQETFVFCCFLPNFLLPGPLLYLRRTDSFVTFGSNWTIESYKYNLLSEASQNSDQEDAAGKKLDADWSFNLGECVIDMQTVSDENTKENYLAILGERNLYCLTQNGKLKFMKRLDYPSSCFHFYNLDNKLMSIIVSTTNTLMIYQETTLRWSAQIHVPAVCINRAFLSNVLGAIVLLSEDGIIQMSYLGTEPSLFAAPPLLNQELDFEKADQELMSLNQMIKSSHSHDIKLTNENAERELQVMITVNPHLEINDDQKTCELTIEVLPQAIFEEVQLLVFVQKPLKASPKTIWYSNLSDRAKFFSYITVDKNVEIPSLSCEVRASFITSLGVPRVTAKTVSLPLTLVMETTSPLKEGEHKVTLNINKNVVPLAMLFPEFSGENSLSINSSAVGFKYISGIGKPVTILTAKNSQRYRLQSDSILTLNIIVQEVVRRLQSNFFNANDFAITIGSSLPTQPVLEYIRRHFEIRQQMNKLQEDTNQLSTQYRLIQKRLISKFKDKNPTPLSKLEALLTDTFDDICSLSHQYEDLTDKLAYAQMDLSCAISLIVTLAKLSGTTTDCSILECTFSPYIYDINFQNWEDLIDAALCFLLRTALAKSEKDKMRAPHASFDEIKDISKLEKHFVTVLERVAKKGVSFNMDNVEKEEESSNQLPNEGREGRELLPIGSKIAESSSRAISARKRSARQREPPLNT